MQQIEKCGRNEMIRVPKEIIDLLAKHILGGQNLREKPVKRVIQGYNQNLSLRID